VSEKLGPTGKFPNGKLGPGDKGELQFAIGEQHGNVVIDFGRTAVTFLAMPPDQAVAFAEVLIAKARIIARRSGKTLTVTIGGH
jgi:hypothetical protein